MGEVNNFLTDLLDEMIASKADAVSITIGQAHRLIKNGAYLPSAMPEVINREELREDASALGFVLLDAVYLYQYYSSRSSSPVFLDCSFAQTGTDTETFTMYARRKPVHTLIVQLRRENPITY